VAVQKNVRHAKPNGYTRNHTFMFRGCRNTSVLLSPDTPEGVEHLMHMFVGKLIQAGFTVTCDNQTGRYDCICRPFGTGFGVTMLGILSGSGASWHGYPEHCFGNTLDLDFNLCYLPDRADHAPALRGVRMVFGEWLRPRRINIYHSDKRFLYPI